MTTKTFSITREQFTVSVDSEAVTLPLTLLLLNDPGGVFVTGVNEYWREVDGVIEVHQIGRSSLPRGEDQSTPLPGSPPVTPEWVDLMTVDPSVSGVLNFIPPSRAPYCDRIADFKAIAEALSQSAGVVPLAEKRRRLTASMLGSPVFRRAYGVARTNTAVNAAITMVSQFVTGAADIPDEILFRYFADLAKSLAEAGSQHALTVEEVGDILELFANAGYNAQRLEEILGQGQE